MSTESSPHCEQTEQSTTPSIKQQLRQFVDTRWVVLVTLFFVTLFLGLPLLWVSHAFSVPAKVAWTIGILLWAALVLYLFFGIMAWCWSTISEIVVLI